MNIESKKISFNKAEGDDFNSIIRKRVNLYFKEAGVSPKSNKSMWAKSLFMMSCVLLAYLAIISDFANGLGITGLYILLGFFVSIGTMNVSHDALHGAYVSNSIGNRVLGLFMDLFGASSFYWKKEHTIDHHTYTNIAEHDADLIVPVVLRLCPNAPLRPYHRFQQWYAPFLYCLNLLHWVYFSDFKRLWHRFNGQKEGAGKPPIWEVALMVFFKLLHVFLFVFVPITLLSLAWWKVLLAYICYLAISGLTLTLIFQLAHIVEDVSFPLPGEEGKMGTAFLKHQLETTSNFGTRSKLTNFLFGGLNFQVEHHIFPHICHIHLHKIAPIVRETAQEFGLPYHEKSSFFTALRSHFRTLKKLGLQPAESVVESMLPMPETVRD